MPATEKMYGQRILLPQTARVQGGVDPAIWNRVQPPIMNTIFMTYRSIGDGMDRPIKPRIRFRCDHGGIMYDLIVDMVRDVDAAEWNAQSFNPGTFRQHVETALSKIASNWARQKFDREIRADQQTVEESDLR